MTDDQIKQMVQRFLMWKLPTSFSPDNGISFKPPYSEEPLRSRHWPVGTNLLSAHEAETMLRYLLEGIEDIPDENPHQDGKDSICKGSWVLGNNCKTCPSCLTELPEYIQHLKNELEDYKKTVSDSIKTMLDTHVTVDRISKSYIRYNLGGFIITDPKIEEVYVTIKDKQHLMDLPELARLINGGARITNIVAVCEENGNVKVNPSSDKTDQDA